MPKNPNNQQITTNLPFIQFMTGLGLYIIARFLLEQYIKNAPREYS